MRKRLTEEELRAKIKRSPLWVQKIATQALDERDEAKAALEKHYESQKPTCVYIEHFDPQGSTKTYIDTDDITIEYAGIELRISLNEYGNRDGKAIELRYGRPDMLSGGDIAIIPKHSGCVELRTPENMIEKLPKRKRR